MAKNRKKTDFTEQNERQRYVREYLDREWAKIRERKAREAEAEQSERR